MDFLESAANSAQHMLLLFFMLHIGLGIILRYQCSQSEIGNHCWTVGFSFGLYLSLKKYPHIGNDPQNSNEIVE